MQFIYCSCTFGVYIFNKSCLKADSKLQFAFKLYSFGKHQVVLKRTAKCNSYSGNRAVRRRALHSFYSDRRPAPLLNLYLSGQEQLKECHAKMSALRSQSTIKQGLSTDSSGRLHSRENRKNLEILSTPFTCMLFVVGDRVWSLERHTVRLDYLKLSASSIAVQESNPATTTSTTDTRTCTILPSPTFSQPPTFDQLLSCNPKSSCSTFLPSTLFPFHSLHHHPLAAYPLSQNVPLFQTTSDCASS